MSIISIVPWLVLIAVVVAVAWFLGRASARRQRGSRSPRATLFQPELPRAPQPSTAPVAPLPALPAAPDPATQDPAVQAVISWLLSQAFEQTGMNVSQDKIAYQRIVETAIKTTTALRTQESVSISLPNLTADATGPKHLETWLSRQGLKALVED